MRRQNEALTKGKLKLVACEDPHVLSYVRNTEEQRILVCLNMSDQNQELDLQDVSSGSALRTLFTTMKDSPSNKPASKLSLTPYAVYVGELK